MDIFVFVIETITHGFEMFVHSVFFLILKLFCVIYSTVLIVDVILLVYLGNVRNQVRTMHKGASNVKTTKRGDVKAWRAIEDRIKTNQQSQLKAAVLEADQMTYKALELQGYNGDNFLERLAQVPQGAFSSTHIIQDVHAISNKIVHGDNILLTQEQTKDILGVYEKFLKNIDYL